MVGNIVSVSALVCVCITRADLGLWHCRFNDIFNTKFIQAYFLYTPQQMLHIWTNCRPTALIFEMGKSIFRLLYWVLEILKMFFDEVYFLSTF